MKYQTATISKFSRPCTKNVLLRDKLFETINSLQNIHAIWIQSPAGAGKTSLISSYFETQKMPCLWYQMDEGDADLASFFYNLKLAVQVNRPDNRQESQLQLLTPEYLSCLPLFTRRFFEQLFVELGPIKRFVLDNYQVVSHKTDFHKAFIHGLDAVPPQRQVVIISREAPHADYTRLRANGNLFVLLWEDLRLSLEESHKIAALRGCHQFNNGRIEKLHSFCEGWAAGLVLLLESFHALDTNCFNTESNTLLDDIFNYFSGEVFDHMAPEIQNLLLKTAYLPKVHALHAGRLTGNPVADDLLRSLSRNQSFVTPYSCEEPVYHYHQLFRQFLITENKRRTDEKEISRIKHLSAQLLIEGGNTEEAAALFIETKDWLSLTEIILNSAESLIEQGRQEILLSWINRLPVKYTIQSPWITYWQGTCLLSCDPISARSLFAETFDGFKKTNDIVGLFQSWAGVIDTFIYISGDMAPLDFWLAELQHLLTRYSLPKGPIEARVTLGMFCALMYRCPEHQDMQLWEDSLRRIIQQVEDSNLKIKLSSQLVLYYTWWIGRPEKAAFLIDIMEAALKDKKVAPIHYIVWRSRQSRFLWMRNRFKESYQALNDGLAVAKETGIDLWKFPLLVNMTYWHLCRQKVEEAQTYLSKMRPFLDSQRYEDIGQYHFLSANVQLCKGDLPLALEHINSAIEFARKSGCQFAYYFYLTGKADILIESGQYTKAESLLDDTSKFGRKMHSLNLKYQFLWLRALIYYKRGDNLKMHYYFQTYLQVSKKNGTVNHCYWRIAAMAPLFIEALHAGIEVEHVQHLISANRVHPPKGVSLPANWPFAVRIYTLGGFSLTVDGRPVDIEMKGKKKPLEILKALVSQDGVSDTRLADDLWPDADGDAALQCLPVTLHRLRKLIGKPEVVLLKAHQVRLNPNLCWVDMLELHRLLDRAANLLQDRRISSSELAQLAETLREKYKGPFLPGDTSSLVIGARQRLEQRWVYIVKQLGKNLERKSCWDTASRLYSHTLSIDELSEWACQGVMRCGHQSGEYADTLTAYQRFKNTLKKTYDTIPSPQTVSLQKQLLNRAKCP